MYIAASKSKFLQRNRLPIRVSGTHLDSSCLLGEMPSPEFWGIPGPLCCCSLLTQKLPGQNNSNSELSFKQTICVSLSQVSSNTSQEPQNLVPQSKYSIEPCVTW